MFNELDNKCKDDMIDDKPENSATNFSKFCFEWLENLVQVMVVFVFLMTFIFRVVTVDGQSMENTLFNQDRLIILRWHYVPKNGDIVVIKQGEMLDKPIVKRVIATEGQKLDIDFDAGTVTVDGVTLNESYIKERMYVRGNAKIPSVIPQGYSFVMGDNRNHSADSRFNEIGLIPHKNIVGRASFRIFPFNRIGSLYWCIFEFSRINIVLK